MKRQARKSVYETNSSSVHTIAIQGKKSDYEIPDTCMFVFGEFGWEVEKHTDTYTKASYLYTMMLCCDDFDKKVGFITDTLRKNGCVATFQPYNKNNSIWDYGHVDHCDPDVVDKILESEDTLLEYLFGNSTVYTYNDNMEYEDLPFIDELTRLDSDGSIVIMKGN